MSKDEDRHGNSESSELELVLELARLDDDLSCLRACREHTFNCLMALREKKAYDNDAGIAIPAPLESVAFCDLRRISAVVEHGQQQPWDPGPHSLSESVSEIDLHIQTNVIHHQADSVNKQQYTCGGSTESGPPSSTPASSVCTIEQTVQKQERARIYWLRIARGNQCIYALDDHAILPVPSVVAASSCPLPSPIVSDDCSYIDIHNNNEEEEEEDMHQLDHIKCVALYKGGAVCVCDDGTVMSVGVPLKSSLGAALLMVQECQARSRQDVKVTINSGNYDYVYTSGENTNTTIHFNSSNNSNNSNSSYNGVRYISTSGYDDSQWYLLHNDGSYCCGKGLPKRLVDRLSRGTVVFLSFGPDNSYFGCFESGRRFWSAETMSVKHFHPRLQDIFRRCHVLNVWLGPGKSYFVRYVDSHKDHERTDWSGLPTELRGYIKGGGCRQLLIDYDGCGPVTFFVRFTRINNGTASAIISDHHHPHHDQHHDDYGNDYVSNEHTIATRFASASADTEITTATTGCGAAGTFCARSEISRSVLMMTVKAPTTATITTQRTSGAIGTNSS